MGTLQRGQHGGGGGGLYRLANISSGLNSSNVCTSDCSPCSFTMGGSSLKTLGGGMSNFLQHFLFFLGATVFFRLGLLNLGYLGGDQYPISPMYFTAGSSSFSSACSVLTVSSAGISLDWTCGSLSGMTSGSTVSIDIGSLWVVDMIAGTLL